MREEKLPANNKGNKMTKTKEEAVLQLLEFCLKTGHHPTETRTWVNKEVRSGSYKGLNSEHLIQETRRALTSFPVW